MKTIFLYTLALGTVFTVISCQDAQKFTINLYKTLVSGSRNAGKNFAVSPFSVETALSMVFLGASGTTKSEMATTLGIAPDATPKSLGNRFKSLRSPAAGYTLNTANKLFLEKTFAILPEFKNNLVSHFESDISPADFKTNANAERIKINTYVEGKTNKKIKNLLPTGSLDAYTKFVIVNAVYFKANWTKEFKKSQTVDQNFSPTNGPAKTVKMMHQLDRFPYTDSSTLGAQLLEMTYKGGEVSMVVILPTKTVGLQGLESNLTPAALESALADLSQNRVKVSFPKFKVETGYSLVNPLKTMGIKAAFGNNADFSAISTQAVKITKVEHKAVVEVDEAGTVAAAATGVVGGGRSSANRPRPPIIFNADHPFIFLIRHNPSKAILFMGRVEDPSSK